MVAVEKTEISVERARDQYVAWAAPWEHYEVYVALRGERARPRITYLDGVLELMSPSDLHEDTKWLLGHLVGIYLEVFDIDFKPVGSWTLKAPHREAGAEPDECFVFTPIEGKTVPDLAIEVIISSGSIKKLDVYARLAVGEVWYWKDGAINVYVLRGDAYEQSLKLALKGVLVSPSFLFLIETPPPPAPAPKGKKSEGGPYRLGHYEVAAHLSYFLWASIPDDELRRAAAAGELSKPHNLAKQVKRMTADPKARRIATEFFGQWLGFYHFNQFRGVDTGRYPEFTEEVKSAMYDEAVSTFENSCSAASHARPFW